MDLNIKLLLLDLFIFLYTLYTYYEYINIYAYYYMYVVHIRKYLWFYKNLIKSKNILFLGKIINIYKKKYE